MLKEEIDETRKLIAEVRDLTWLSVKYGKWKFSQLTEALDALRDYALAEEHDTKLGEMDMRAMRKAALAKCPPVRDPDKVIWNSTKPKRKARKC